MSNWISRLVDELVSNWKKEKLTKRKHNMVNSLIDRYECKRIIDENFFNFIELSDDAGSYLRNSNSKTFSDKFKIYLNNNIQNMQNKQLTIEEKQIILQDINNKYRLLQAYFLIFEIYQCNESELTVLEKINLSDDGLKKIFLSLCKKVEEKAIGYGKPSLPSPVELKGGSTGHFFAR